MIVDSGDAAAIELLQAVRTGDPGVLRRLLTDRPEMASAQIRRRKGTLTALRMATDWPGYFSHAAETVHLLLDAGADPNTLTDGGPAPETPLYWTASSDDVDVAEVLIDGGADLETAGGSIGTPLDNAVGYGCWHVARLPAARGAMVDKLWHAAALGLTRRVVELLTTSPTPGSEEVTEAFWQACHAGQCRTAEHLLLSGADINGVPATPSSTRWMSPPGLALRLRPHGGRRAGRRRGRRRARRAPGRCP